MYEAFAERAAIYGEEVVAAFVAYLYRRGAGDRFDAGLVGDIASIDADRASRLLELAAGPEFTYVAREEVLRCPNCEQRTRRDVAEAELAEEESIRCVSCDSEFDDLRSWTPLVQYRMTEKGLAEGNANPPSASVVILTALQVEYEAVIAHLDGSSVERDQGTIYGVGSFRGHHVDWRVAVAISGQGGDNAATAAERAIDHFDADVALFVGIAGGLAQQSMKWGTVVAATEVENYEWGVEGITFQPRHKVGKSAHSLREQASQVAMAKEWPRRSPVKQYGEEPPDAVVAPIAAGDKLIRSADSTVYERLRQTKNRAVAVEMEGHGFLTALEHNEKVSGLVIRGISDLCDDKARGGEASQRVAAANAAAFAFELLDHYALVQG